MAKIEMPVENPNKYGTFEDVEEKDRNAISNILGGNSGAGSGVSPLHQSELSDADDVDAEFLRQAGNSATHYGR